MFIKCILIALFYLNNIHVVFRAYDSMSLSIFLHNPNLWNVKTHCWHGRCKWCYAYAPKCYYTCGHIIFMTWRYPLKNSDVIWSFLVCILQCCTIVWAFGWSMMYMYMKYRLDQSLFDCHLRELCFMLVTFPGSFRKEKEFSFLAAVDY